MAEGNDQEKTEPATPKKRQEARKKGQVAQSREISSVAVLLGALTVFYFGGSWMFRQLMEITYFILNQAGNIHLGINSLQTLLWTLFLKIVVTLAPLMLVVAFVGVASNIAQFGFMLNGESLTPRLSKLNPINGFKRLFSLRALIELVKSVFKVMIVGGMAYTILKGQAEKIPALIDLNVPDILGFMGHVSLKIGFYTCLILIVLAGLDYIFQRWQHERDLRMSKQEVKDEHKQREGDPLVRSRIRTAQREMAMRRMMADIPKATVVITNPTHLAIALKFERSMQAPMLVAKGAGHVAERIRNIAEQHDIPIIEQKPLARALYKKVEIGHYIPAELYHAVAEILAYVYRLKGLQHAAA
jgi:flagellar biosynthetic protein FlhB